MWMECDCPISGQPKEIEIQNSDNRLAKTALKLIDSNNNEREESGLRLLQNYTDGQIREVISFFRDWLAVNKKTELDEIDVDAKLRKLLAEPAVSKFGIYVQSFIRELIQLELGYAGVAESCLCPGDESYQTALLQPFGFSKLDVRVKKLANYFHSQELNIAPLFSCRFPERENAPFQLSSIADKNATNEIMVRFEPVVAPCRKEQLLVWNDNEVLLDNLLPACKTIVEVLTDWLNYDMLKKERAKTQKTRSPTANEKLSGFLTKYPEAVDWSRKKLAEETKMPESTIQSTEAWKRLKNGQVE